MDASILICTFNRAESLGRTLESLCRLRTPNGAAWQVVVVDNASTDGTGETIDAFAERLPLVGGREPTPGKSHALNSGLDLCSGRYVFLTDDDVIVDPEWLAASLAALQATGADAVFGRILPLWPHEPPKWYGPRLAPALALLDYGPEPFDLEPGREGFFGANAVIARQAIEELGRWSTVLNRAGAGLVMGEDSDICNRLVRAGKRVRYEPASLVHHDVGAHRLDKPYFRRWFKAHGQSAVLRGGEFAEDGLKIAGAPAYLWRMAAQLGAGSLWRRVAGPAAEAFAHETRLHRVLGAIGQFRRARAERRQGEGAPCR